MSCFTPGYFKITVIVNEIISVYVLVSSVNSGFH